MIGLAVKSVVKGLGDFEEVVAAGHDFPADVEPQFLGKRNNAIEHFSDAAANSGRIHHLDASLA